MRRAMVMQVQSGSYLGEDDIVRVAEPQFPTSPKMVAVDGSTRRGFRLSTVVGPVPSAPQSAPAHYKTPPLGPTPLALPPIVQTPQATHTLEAPCSPKPSLLPIFCAAMAGALVAITVSGSKK